MPRDEGKLYIIGIGPGNPEGMTVRAQQALAASEIVVGYEAYIALLGPLCEGKVVISSGMGKEQERCEAALREAFTGRSVALVSSGDAGIYGMAGLALDIALHKKAVDRVAIEIIPGVPAFVAAAALVGAPLTHDFAVISLSDLLTPWEKIAQRLEAAADADFVVCLYNPRSTQRTHQLEQAREIIMRYRAGQTPCAIVRNAYRPGQSIVTTSLHDLLQHQIDMLCIVFIGNSETRMDGPWMITPRGYRLSDGG
jgi:precorrin-3B C17-methyltransferase